MSVPSVAGTASDGSSFGSASLPAASVDRRAHDVRQRTGRGSSQDVEQVPARGQLQVVEVCLPGRVEADRADQTPPVPREQLELLTGAQPTLQDHVPAVGRGVRVELPCEIVGGPADVAAHDEGIMYGRGVRGIVVRLGIRARWEGIADGQLDVIVERREWAPLTEPVLPTPRTYCPAGMIWSCAEAVAWSGSVLTVSSACPVHAIGVTPGAEVIGTSSTPVAVPGMPVS